MCSAEMAWDDPKTGLTYILEVNEGLWFGEQMRHSLANPNQCRAYGISVCDDPFDPYRELGIQDPQSEVCIPFEMDGTVAFFETRIPTEQESMESPRIILTSEEEWNPATVQLRARTYEQEEHHRIMSAVAVNRVNMQANPNEPQFVHGTRHEPDLILASVSSAMTDETMVTRMVSKVNIATHLREQPQEGESVEVHAIETRPRH